MNKILTHREYQELPDKITKPLALWRDIAGKKSITDCRRGKVGAESGHALGDESPTPRQQRGRAGRDVQITSQGEEHVVDHSGETDSFDTTNTSEGGIREELAVQGALMKTAEFLAGR